MESLLLTEDWTGRWGRDAAREFASTKSIADFDAVIVDVPPIAAVLPLTRMARDQGVPIILDFRDIWVLSDLRWSVLSFFSPTKRRRAALNAQLEELLEAADILVYTSDDAAEAAQELLPNVGPSKVRVIPNAYDRVYQPPLPSQGTGRPLVFVHAGSLSYGRDALLVDFLRGLILAQTDRGINVRLNLIGGVPPSVDAAIAELGLKSVVSTEGWLSRDQAVAKQLDADVLLLLQPTGETLGPHVAIPGKLFEYMAVRRPILSLASHAANEVVRENHLGVVIESRSPPVIADAMASMSEWVSSNPILPPPPEEYSESHTVAQFARVIDKILSARR